MIVKTTRCAFLSTNVSVVARLLRPVDLIHERDTPRRTTRGPCCDVAAPAAAEPAGPDAVEPEPLEPEPVPPAAVPEAAPPPLERPPPLTPDTAPVTAPVADPVVPEA